MKHWIIYVGCAATVCLLSLPFVMSRNDDCVQVVLPGDRFRLTAEEIDRLSESALISGDLLSSVRLLNYYEFCCWDQDMSLLWLILSAAMGDVKCGDYVKSIFHTQDNLDEAVHRLAKRIQLKRKNNKSPLDVVISILSEGGVGHMRNGTGMTLDFVKDAIVLARECNRKVRPR